MKLREFWREHPRAAIAFSGGVDSAYLLHSAVDAGADVTAYFVKTELQPVFELRDARDLAERLGARLVILERSALEEPLVVRNGSDRCYHCKRRILETILRQAKADGYPVLLDGTNASDDAGDRPGSRALKELEVLSPLRLCGLTKQEIRRRAREAGLPSWNKPAYACLATRIPTGTAITPETLSAVEQAEDWLFAHGFTDFRVRKTANGAKLQLPASQMAALLAQRQAVTAALEPLVGPLTLDLRPRESEEPQPQEDLLADEAAELRCNLDDMTGEEIAFAAEVLLEQGALDVWTAPITMKKGRPAVQLSCLCRVADVERMTLLLLRHTTTLGVRRSLVERSCLRRTVRDCAGVRIKTSQGGGVVREKAEFEDLAALARREGKSLFEIRKERGL